MFQPLAEQYLTTDRNDNASISDRAFLVQQALLGPRDECVEDGSNHIRIETSLDEDDLPSPSHHRWTMRQRSIAKMRSQSRALVVELLRRVRGAGELPNEFKLAIDLAPGHKWHGELSRDEDGNVNDMYRLAGKEQEYAMRYASIRILNEEFPLFLDSQLVTRGMRRADIVRELLSTAVSILKPFGIDIVLMDRAFDGQGVKEVHEEFDLSYLNLRKRRGDEKATIMEMQENDEIARVEVSRDEDGQPQSAKLFLPNSDDNASKPQDTGERGGGADHTSRSQVVDEDLQGELGFDFSIANPAGSVSPEEVDADIDHSLREEMAEELGIELDDEDGTRRSSDRDTFRDVIEDVA